MSIRKVIQPPGEAEMIAERRAKAWQLRRAGRTVYSISEQLTREGYPASPTTIARDLDHEREQWRELEGAEAQAWRDDMVAKLDHIIETQMRLADTPNNARSADNANAARQAMERKAKLLGLDAPTPIDTAVGTWVDLFNTVAGYVKDAGEA